MPHRLLEQNDLPLEIEIHMDPLCTLPAALSRRRAFKLNKVVQEEMADNKGGAAECLFCNPEKLDAKPTPSFHLDRKVISFSNAAPFLPGDQRVICLWHDDYGKRYNYAHRFRFDDFGVPEFYYLVMAAVGLAKEFPATADGRTLQRGLNLIRCVLGFNIGRLAGQSIPHFHLQYGWEVVLTAKDIGPELLSLYYAELRQEKLILHEDNRLLVIVPWTPKGQYHIEIHFKNKYELSHLETEDIKILAHLQNRIARLYSQRGIRNLNVIFTGSPHDKVREPLVIQFIPRVNMTALYEMIGVNVVDTLPANIVSFFSDSFRWSDILAEASQLDPEALYSARFSP